MGYKFSRRMDNIKSSTIRDMMKYTQDPEIINFAGGLPAPELFPIEELRKVFDRVLVEEGKVALQYSSTEGYLPLRQKIAQRMKMIGINCNENNVFMVQGGQQGLDLAGKMFIDEGDIVICENPTFLGGINAFNPNMPKYVGVSMDKDGIIIGELEKALEANPKAKFIYTIPDFHNPTGVTLSLERRKSLVELANKYEVMIIEDNPYREIRYEGEVLPSLKSFDTKGLVIHLGTFSKILSPGIRLGWVVAEEEIIQKFVSLKQGADTQTSTIIQMAVNEYMEMFDLGKHIGEIKKLYKRKKDLMMELMKKEFPETITYTNPQGGLFTWLNFPEGIDAGEMLKKALVEEKVAFVQGTGFYPNGGNTNHCRINYSGMTEEQIVEGLKRLGRVFKSYLQQ